MKYVCDVCGWEYDEEAGYPEGGIAPAGGSGDFKVDSITVNIWDNNQLAGLQEDHPSRT